MFADVDLRPASLGEVDEVLLVLDDASRRLQERAIRQWPAAFEAAWITPDIAAGETWLARRAGVPIATITLGWTDPLWPNDELAGYVHRMARTSEAPGISDQLLRWADERVREDGRRLLRLDCVSSNPGLRRFYESRGFLYRGDAVVGGPPGSRSSESDKTSVSLYEREVP